MDALQIGSTIIPRRCILPDNKQWTNRFVFESFETGNKYTIAQSKSTGQWGCSCWAWRKNRTCKHLRELGLEQ